MTAAAGERAERIRVQGLVQGVGFRPTVWRLAQRHRLRGWVSNDGLGVDMHVCGNAAELDAFARALTAEAPPLAHVEAVLRQPAAALPAGQGFAIVASGAQGAVRTGVAPDAATCAACLQEVRDPAARRHRYPFTNCTQCGPRLAITLAVPYDRATTTMRGFAMCAACAAEYANPTDRRFHAQPIACPACGPRAWLVRADGSAVEDGDASDASDAVTTAATLLQRGQIVAIKGLGGFQLACDASDEAAVARLRQRKRRAGKPFALMVRDLEMARRHAHIGAAEAALLASAAAPIVIVDALVDPDRAAPLARSVAPGLRTLGLMLPNTPLHHLLLQQLDRPVVLTSGNLSDEPQCIANDEALARLAGIADAFLLHDRDVARRVDDSVQRVLAGAPRMLRRARGHAPAPLQLPAGFAAAPPLLALGGELKNSFCLLGEGRALLSHHIGDLGNAATWADGQAALAAYAALFAHDAQAVAVDAHPDYRSAQWGREHAAAHGLPLLAVQHHHAHVAACMAENGLPLHGAPVLGVVLDGLGHGEGGEWWGGEFLCADYRSSTRLARFKPVALLGGAMAMREPWRNTYAHLVAALGWAHFDAAHAGLELHRFLAARPRALLDGMLAGRINSPLASSCGRLFDAVAAAAGVCREHTLYEGQPAIEFEALADAATVAATQDAEAYPFDITESSPADLPCIEPRPMWQALLRDLALATPVAVVSARFHIGLAMAIARMAAQLARQRAATGSPFAAVVLSGGVFQNRLLFEQVQQRLQRLQRTRHMGLPVLSHHRVPAHDGGLALGQAAVAAARLLQAAAPPQETSACASASLA